MLVWNRSVREVPGYIVVLLAGTVAIAVLGLACRDDRQPVRRHPARMAAPRRARSFVRSLIPTLASPALTIALLGALESLMSAVVADRMGGDRHNPNVELVAQGVANIVSPLFGGLPATGAIARTATNIRSGARTPVAGMIHALTLLRCCWSPRRWPGSSRSRCSRRSCWWSPTTWASGREIPELLKLTRDGHQRVAGHVRADRLRRPDDRGRSRDGPGDAPVHPKGVADDDRIAGDDGVRRIGTARTSSRTSRFPDYVSVFRIHGPFLFGATRQDRARSPITSTRWRRS